MDVLHPQLRSHRETGRSWPALVWQTGEALRMIASAPHGGGLGPRRWVVNAQVPSSYGRRHPDDHLEALAAAYGLPGRGVGMLTAAEVRSVRTRSDGGVDVAVTVGLGTPTWAAAPDIPGTVAATGTINVMAFVPERLADAALVNAVGTVTEAKAQALWEMGVPATGTATDAVCIACPDGRGGAAFAGPRSTWGARLARAVHAAVMDGAAATTTGGAR
ncbi:MAG: adenosylcobinamide amidohydrolase [Acidimicrobiales bacterium]